MRCFFCHNIIPVLREFYSVQEYECQPCRTYIDIDKGVIIRIDICHQDYSPEHGGLVYMFRYLTKNPVNLSDFSLTVVRYDINDHQIIFTLDRALPELNPDNIDRKIQTLMNFD